MKKRVAVENRAVAAVAADVVVGVVDVPVASCSAVAGDAALAPFQVVFF